MAVVATRAFMAALRDIPKNQGTQLFFFAQLQSHCIDLFSRCSAKLGNARPGLAGKLLSWWWAMIFASGFIFWLEENFCGQILRKGCLGNSHEAQPKKSFGIGAPPFPARRTFPPEFLYIILELAAEGLWPGGPNSSW
jgi:hypothetical protein